MKKNVSATHLRYSGFATYTRANKDANINTPKSQKKWYGGRLKTESKQDGVSVKHRRSLL